LIYSKGGDRESLKVEEWGPARVERSKRRKVRNTRTTHKCLGCWTVFSLSIHSSVYLYLCRRTKLGSPTEYFGKKNYSKIYTRKPFILWNPVMILPRPAIPFLDLISESWVSFALSTMLIFIFDGFFFQVGSLSLSLRS